MRGSRKVCVDTDRDCDAGRCPRNKYQDTFAVSGKKEPDYTGM